MYRGPTANQGLRALKGPRGLLAIRANPDRRATLESGASREPLEDRALQGLSDLRGRKAQWGQLDLLGRRDRKEPLELLVGIGSRG